jgi:hypothetical protein
MRDLLQSGGDALCIVEFAARSFQDDKNAIRL